MGTIHGLSVHLHTGILVISLILFLLCMIVKLIEFLYPRWALVRDLFTDWELTRKIWDKREPIFKGLSNTLLICIILGIIGLVIGMSTGTFAVYGNFDDVVNKAKLILSLYALVFYGLALGVGVLLARNQWNNAGLIAIYGMTVGFGFFFVFLDGAVGGIMTYGDSIAIPILQWLDSLGFFEFFGLEDLLFYLLP